MALMLIYGTDANLDIVVKIMEGKIKGSKDLLNKIAGLIIKNHVDKYGVIPLEVYSYFGLSIPYTLMSDEITLEKLGVNYDGTIRELFKDIIHAFDGECNEYFSRNTQRVYWCC